MPAAVDEYFLELGKAETAKHRIGDSDDQRAVFIHRNDGPTGITAEIRADGERQGAMQQTRGRLQRFAPWRRRKLVSMGDECPRLTDAEDPGIKRMLGKDAV